ncbi:MAG: TrkA family potassium uptake protein [Chloroflexi bacterium]|nr:TrkA family potassium uptake protein [Chloroflexota bacterium]MCZ6707937.1 TrkA family potassium uptake protein [Chloroflexota bacterium]
MKFVIMGCGRLGRTVATELDSEGHEVVVIDFDEGAFHLLPAGFSGRTVLGNGVDKEIQRQAGTPDADVFMALANGDNRNAMAAQVAKHLHGVERVIARIFDTPRAEIYSELGVEAVNPTSIVADLVRQAAFGA